MKFDNSVSVVKSQCYSNANQIELVLNDKKLGPADLIRKERKKERNICLTT